LFLATPVKTVVFVYKEGGWAYSAGTFILLAADFAIVHPEASIGAAEPRTMAGEVREADPKVVEGMASWIKSLAERNQRNSEIAEKFVRENLTLTGKEAKEAGIINETARNLDELFLKLEISEPKIIKIQPTPIERFFDFLLIGLWGMGIIQFSIFGILLILLGLFLLIMEVFQPGFGIFGGLGIVSLILGIFTFEAEPFLSPQIFEAMTMIVFGALLAICILFVIIGRGVVKSLREKPKAGPEALISEVALVRITLDPAGRVEVKGEIWLAQSLDGKTILKGTKVEIVKVEGNTLYVKESK